MKRFKGPSITLAQFQEVARWDGKATSSKYVSYKLYPIYSNMFYIYHILYIQMCFRYFSYDISHPWFSACVKDRTSHQRMRCVDSPLSSRKHFKTLSDKSLVWEDIAASKFFSTALRESQCLWCWRRGLGADESLQVRQSLSAYYLSILNIIWKQKKWMLLTLE